MPADATVIGTPPILSFDARSLQASQARCVHSSTSGLRKLHRIVKPNKRQISLLYSTSVDTELTETSQPVHLTALTPEMADGSNVVKEELPHENGRPETHLMLFINGLNGNAGNWDVLIDKLSHYASANEIAILVSTANMSLKVSSLLPLVQSTADLPQHFGRQIYAIHLPQRPTQGCLWGL